MDIKILFFLDDDESLTSCAGFPVIGKTEEASRIDGDKIVAIGNAEIRSKIQSTIDTVTLIHPDSTIGSRVSIGKGTVVMAGVVINPDVTIGDGCIINTSSSIDHDCSIDDFVHVSVGAHLCGTVHVGENTWIGAGVTVSNNINICGGCMIGAGAVVTNDIEEEGIYIGVPAKKMYKPRLTWGYSSTRINQGKSKIMYPSVLMHNSQLRRVA